MGVSKSGRVEQPGGAPRKTAKPRPSDECSANPAAVGVGVAAMRENRPVPLPSSSRSSAGGDRTTTWLTAVMVFLCSADTTFATRVAGLNLRWGQLLLGAWAAVLLWRRVRSAFGRSPRRSFLPAGFRESRVSKAMLSGAGLFVGAGLLGGFGADAIEISLLKLGWWLFNIGSVAVVLGTTHQHQAMAAGVRFGVGALAAVIVIDAFVIDVIGTDWPAIGHAQYSYLFDKARQLRPHAFFYEPSYAASALVLGLCFLLITGETRLDALITVLVGAAVVMTTARTGLAGLGVVTFIAAAMVLAHRPSRRHLRRWTTIALTIVAVLAGFFVSTPKTRSCWHFLTGPLGPSAIVERLGAPEPEKTSEGARVDSLKQSVERWQQSPVVGGGVAEAGPERPLEPATMVTWGELLSEAGIVGVTGFATLLCALFWLAWRRARPERRLFVAAAFGAHTCVNLVFTQNYPRLDYWLLLGAMAFLSRADDAATETPRSDVSTAPTRTAA